MVKAEAACRNALFCVAFLALVHGEVNNAEQCQDDMSLIQVKQAVERRMPPYDKVWTRPTLPEELATINGKSPEGKSLGETEVLEATSETEEVVEPKAPQSQPLPPSELAAVDSEAEAVEMDGLVAEIENEDQQNKDADNGQQDPVSVFYGPTGAPQVAGPSISAVSFPGAAPPAATAPSMPAAPDPNTVPVPGSANTLNIEIGGVGNPPAGDMQAFPGGMAPPMPYQGAMPGMMPGAMPGMMPGAMPGMMPGAMPGAPATAAATPAAGSSSGSTGNAAQLIKVGVEKIAQQAALEGVTAGITAGVQKGVAAQGFESTGSTAITEPAPSNMISMGADSMLSMGSSAEDVLSSVMNSDGKSNVTIVVQKPNKM